MTNLKYFFISFHIAINEGNELEGSRLLEGGAETEVEPVPERYPVHNTWFSKWVDFQRACSPNLETVEFMVALLTNGNKERASGPFYHIHLAR